MLRYRGLALAHLPGNAVLLYLAYYWLGIGEATPRMLGWSLLVALVVMALTCWLHGAALASFAGEARPWLLARSHLAPLTLGAIVVLALYLLLGRWPDWDSAAATMASWFTLQTHRPVRPAAVLRVCSAAWWLLRWLVLPGLLLPVAGAVVQRGWAGFAAVSLRRNWRYWLAVPLLLLAALWLPLRLLDWVPKVNGFGMEVVSFTLRAAAAYALFVAAWLMVERMTAGRA